MASNNKPTYLNTRTTDLTAGSPKSKPVTLEDVGSVGAKAALTGKALEVALLRTFSNNEKLLRSALDSKGIPKAKQDDIITKLVKRIGLGAYSGMIKDDQDVIDEINNTIASTDANTSKVNDLTQQILDSNAPMHTTTINPSGEVTTSTSTNEVKSTSPQDRTQPFDITSITGGRELANNAPETQPVENTTETVENPPAQQPTPEAPAAPSSVSEITQQMPEATATPEPEQENYDDTERPYFVRNNGVPIYSNDGYSVPGRLRDYSYSMINGNRDAIHAPGEINETNSVQINPSKKTTQTREQPVEEPDRNYVVANNSVPYYENTPGEGIDAHSPDRRDYSYGYENGERRVVNPPGEINESNSTTTVRPVDRGRFDYIRNNGWGSNSSILTRMGYSQDEIRRILDSTGAVRPEYFSY